MLAGRWHTHSSVPLPHATPPSPATTATLITEPNDGMAPITTAIANAKKSIDLIMYQCQDTILENALIAAAQRGVSVRVLLNGGYYGARKAQTVNDRAYEHLSLAGIPVRWTPAFFALTHEKSLIIDHATAFILTFNFTAQYYATGRDFGIVDQNPADVAAMDVTFTADWNHVKRAAPSGDDLVWSPGSENDMLGLILNAKKSLAIYNEEMADGPVIHALEAAAQRGVIVSVLMTDGSNWQRAFRELAAAGVAIHVFSRAAPLYIHAKMILADDAIVFLGSENFSAPSLEDNRELGIVLTNSTILHSLASTFHADWIHATPFP
jgi:cardiolipin synthase